MKFQIRTKIEMKTRIYIYGDGNLLLLWMEIVLHDFENQNEDDKSGDEGPLTARKRMEMTNQQKSWIALMGVFFIGPRCPIYGSCCL